MDNPDQRQDERLFARRWRAGALEPLRVQPTWTAPARPELQRLAELLEAFVDLARERVDLAVRGAAGPPAPGFAVRWQPEPTSAGGELVVGPDGGRLTTWSGAGARAPRGSGERSLRLDLGVGFRWETLIFPDAERLAYALLRWLEARVAWAGRDASSAGGL